MKKLLSLSGLLLLLGGVSYAGVPRETFFMGQPPLSHTTIQGSSTTASGTANLTLAVAPLTVNGNSCRTCLTKYIVQLASTTVFNVLDAGTTIQIIDGADLGATGPNTYSALEDHLGPLCIAAGDTLTMNTQNTATGGSLHTTINYEGYTWCGGTNNAGN